MNIYVYICYTKSIIDSILSYIKGNNRLKHNKNLNCDGNLINCIQRLSTFCFNKKMTTINDIVIKKSTLYTHKVDHKKGYNWQISNENIQRCVCKY